VREAGRHPRRQSTKSTDVEPSSLPALWDGRRSRNERACLDLAARLDQIQAGIDEVETLLVSDALTSLCVRSCFQRALAVAVERADRQAAALAVAVIDLNGLDALNQTHGYKTGDRALVFVAECLVGCLRAGDIASRIGGGQFGLLLTNATIDQAAERLRVLLADIASGGASLERRGAGGPVTLSASCGVAGLEPGEIPLLLLRRAEDALLEAKRSSRNQLVARTLPLG
jgi:diguanylate cyclase (GGDEF)-like protein